MTKEHLLAELEKLSDADQLHVWHELGKRLHHDPVQRVPVVTADDTTGPTAPTPPQSGGGGGLTPPPH